MKHCLVEIDVNCIPILKALKGQLILEISYEIKRKVPGFKVHKKTKRDWYQLIVSVSVSAHYSVQ